MQHRSLVVPKSKASKLASNRCESALRTLWSQHGLGIASLELWAAFSSGRRAQP